MKWLIDKPGSGKTVELIKMAAKDDLLLVVENRRAIDEAMVTARWLKLHIRLPITFEEFRARRYYQHGFKGFAIDNVDMFLAHTMAHDLPIIAASATNHGEFYQKES